MTLSMLVNHPKLDDLYDPLLDDSEHACKSFEIGCYLLLDDHKYVYTDSRCLKSSKCGFVEMTTLLQENNQTTKGYITDAKHVD